MPIGHGRGSLGGIVSKGSNRRPRAIEREVFTANWDATFRTSAESPVEPVYVEEPEPQTASVATR